MKVHQKNILIFFLLLSVNLTGCYQKATSTVLAIDTYRVSYQFTLVSNNSVGNEWRKEITCNGHVLTNGQEIPANGRQAILLKVTVVEDDTYPDVGCGELTLRLQDGSTAGTEIIVRENRGRYRGNLAVWKIMCAATAV